MKKKVLLSSIGTIALCLCLIAGSTFALFTSQSEINIAVTAGKVEMIASVEDFKLYSVEAKADGTIVDENGGKYEYVERTDGKFINGGTAVLDGSMITLDKITPGDKISFGINGANNSDVFIQCRYIIQCAGDEALMKGLLVYINGVAYPALKSYTSEWTALEVGTSITDEKNIEIVVELPITAGNEYQEKTTAINVLVEAVQGNADVDGYQAIAQFLNGAVDLSNLTVTDTVANYGKVELVGGSIAVDNSGFENYGDATLTDTTVAAGTAGTQAYGYAYIGREGSTTVLNDVTVKSANGAIAAEGGAQVTMNSGYVEVDSKNTSGRYLIYAVGDGTVVTVNGGEFFFNKTQNQKRAYAYVGAGATLYINGGSFGTASTKNGYTAGILTENDQANVIITGGTFGFDPSAWVPAGYVADYDTTNKTWTVYFPQSSFDDLINNAAAGATVEVPAGNFKLSGNNDIVIVGSGEKTVIDIDGNIQNAYVSNATITGNNSFNVQEGNTIVFENVVFDGNVGMTAQGVVKGNATFKNCTFKAGFHIDQSLDTVNVAFEGCTFGELGYIKLGGSANYSMTDCTIETLDSGASGPWGKQWIISYSDISFTNCKIGRVIRAGSAITITLDGCVDTNDVAVSEAIVHTYNAPTVVIK